MAMNRAETPGSALNDILQPPSQVNKNVRDIFCAVCGLIANPQEHLTELFLWGEAMQRTLLRRWINNMMRNAIVASSPTPGDPSRPAASPRNTRARCASAALSYGKKLNRSIGRKNSTQDVGSDSGLG